MGNVLEANLAAAKLRGAGINAQVEPTNAFAATGLSITLNDQGVGILVPESQVEQAEEVLEEFRAESSGAEGGTAIEEEGEEIGDEAGEKSGMPEKESDHHLSWGCILLILLAVAVVVVGLSFLRRR
jgi:hypothetical protein